MRIELDDLETDFAASVPDIEPPIVADTDKVRVLPVRKLNPNLPRKRVVREPSCACCPGCGGDLRATGEDSEEMLDLVAQAWQVMVTIRPKYSCRTCDKIIQAPAPAKAIARDKLSYAALAHIMMAKRGYHLPFYRQAQMMAAKGVDIERSTLARSAGYAAALLDPIYSRIREIGRARTKIHTDDTRLPILAPSTGKTHKGALWVYVADDRNSGSQEPPIAWYRATMGRAGESVMTELAGFTGTLQCRLVSAAITSSTRAAPFEKLPAWPICVARYSTFTTATRPSSARRPWPVSRRFTGSRKRYGGSRPPSDWPHDECGPDHWSARCDDSSCARAAVCRAMPISRRPSPMAPGDGARSTASSTMASSSPTT